MKRALAIGLSGAAVVALGLVGSAGSASAACVKTDLSTGYQGPGSTTNVASSSSCADLNLTRANDTTADNYDGYRGYYYKSSTGQWIAGSNGWHFTSDFNASSSANWIVLLTDINNGTKVGVGSYYDSGDSVTVAT